MRKLILLSMLTIPLLFSGCTCQPKIKYIKSKCPKLQVVNKTIQEPAPVKLEILP